MVRRLLLGLAILCVAWPAASADLDCSRFTKEAAQARFVESLRQTGVSFTVDPARGVGFQISAENTERFNRLVDEATARVSNDIITQENQRGAPGMAAQARLRESASQLREAVGIFPGSWPSMWTLGKIHQRLGEHSESLQWFLRAYEVNPTQADVAREAGLAALDSGRHADAACLFTAALEASPNDAGLHANLALAYLVIGRLQDARTHAEVAVEKAPSDRVSGNVLKLVREVQAGTRPPPKSTAEFP